MEQLGSGEINALLAMVRADAARVRPDPWAAPSTAAAGPGRSSPPPGAAMLPPESPPAPAAVGGAGDLPASPVSVERRLVHRAERLWEELRAGAAMPAALAAAPLLGGMFAANAFLLTFPPVDVAAGADAAPDVAVVAHVGPAVRDLGLILPGPVRPSPALEDSLDCRLAALGWRAVATGRPQRFSSESHPEGREPGSPPMLLRAVALPVAAGGCSGAAIVILSWRKLLSPDETAALHRELAAAIHWMSQQRPDHRG